MDIQLKLRLYFWATITLCVLLTIFAFDVSEKWFLDQSFKFLELGSNTFRNVMLIIAAALTAIFAWWRAREATLQNKLTELGLNLDRLQTGANMLGNKEISVREMGVGSLQQLFLQNRKAYGMQIIRVLMTFVEGDQAANKKNVIDGVRLNVASDHRSAIQALAGMNVWYLQQQHAFRRGIDCRFAYLHNTLLNNCNMSAFNLFGANLTHCELENVDLSGAMLDEADLSDANLCNATVTNTTFWGAVLTDANFKNVDLSKAIGLDFRQLSEATNVDQEFLKQLALHDGINFRDDN